ncbi:hypothetical protein [Sinomicrobium pectinilyticum]|uniref:hypothetical protein n=1 Tax=Sinomicrobium pectinilyticum TaxID=1084421 RepID=UPI0011CDAF01|nr:hypothetical protein [Sinomicrobium pectinilyticum]
MIFSILTVLGLYAVSDKLTHEHNSFHRSFPPHPIIRAGGIDLKYNSYYIAGTDSNRVYLSNLTAPLHLLSVNLPDLDTTHIRLSIEDPENTKFRRNTKVEVLPPYFYITDGVTPRLLRGKIGEWHARRFMYDSAFFSVAIPIGPKSFALRSTSSKTREHVLGKETNKSPHVKLVPGLLEKQVDGIFCTDGMLHYNRELSQLIYLYHYRNQYIVTDTSLNLLYRRNTIDTNSRAKIKTATITSENSKTMATPPLMVNKRSATYGDRLLVHSDLMAKNESKKAFSKASVIDVYHLKRGKYEMSFYIYPYNELKLTNFEITNKNLIALHGQYLVVYNTHFDMFNRGLFPGKVDYTNIKTTPP